MINDVAHAPAGDVGLEVVLDRRDGRRRLGHVVSNELGELLFQQLVLALEARDEAEDLLQDLAQGDAPVHGGGFAQLVEVVVLLGLVEDLAVDVVDDPVPLAGLNRSDDDRVFAHGLLKALKEHPVYFHTFVADGLFLHRGENVGAEVLVGALVHDRPGAAAFVARLARWARELQHLVVVELGLEVLAVGEEVEELEGGLVRLGNAFAQRVVKGLLAEVVLARAAPLDLDEVGRREDRAEQAKVEDVGAVVACGHHADGDADARLAGLVGRDEVAGTHQIVVGEVDRKLLGVGHLRGDLHGKVGLVLAGKHAVGDLVEHLRQLGGVVLADREDDGLADFAADRVAQGVLEESLTEDGVGGVGEESFLELALFEGLLLVLAGVVVERDDEALIGEQLRGDFRASVHHGRVDQVAVFHAVEQGIAEGRLAALAAEGAVGVQKQAALGLARVAGAGVAGVEAPQVVPGRGGQAQLVADEVVEHRAGVAADGAVGLVRDHEVEVRRRKEALVFVVEKQRLHRGDHDFGAAPVVAVLLVDHGLEVGRQQRRKRLLGLVFQFETVHQEEHASGVAGAQEELHHRGGGERLAGARRHLEQEAVLAVPHGGLELVDGFELVGAQEAQLVGLDVGGALRLVLPPGLGLVVRALRQDDVVVGDVFVDQALRIRRDLLVAGYRIRRRERSDDVGIPAFQVPEVVQVAVGEDDEAAVLRSGVLAGLLLADERVIVFGFGFQDDQRKAAGVEQEEVDEPARGLLEVLAEGVEVGGLDGHRRLEADVGRAAAVREEAPARCFEQLVDLDSGCGFLLGHSGSSFSGNGGQAA